MLCKDCKWYGKEVINLSRDVFDPLLGDAYRYQIGGIRTIHYSELRNVCNIHNTSVILDNRVDACSQFQEIQVNNK